MSDGLRFAGGGAASTVPDLSGLYRQLPDGARGGQSNAPSTGTTILLPDNAVSSGNNAAARGIIRIDPAKFTLSGKTAKLRIAAVAVANATDPAATITIGLYPAGTFAGGSTGVQSTPGTLVSGSGVALTPPVGSSGAVTADGSDFSFPTAGVYLLCFTCSASLATNSAVVVRAVLEQRWV